MFLRQSVCLSPRQTVGWHEGVERVMYVVEKIHTSQSSWANLHPCQIVLSTTSLKRITPPRLNQSIDSPARLFFFFSTKLDPRWTRHVLSSSSALLADAEIDEIFVWYRPSPNLGPLSSMVSPCNGGRSYAVGRWKNRLRKTDGTAHPPSDETPMEVPSELALSSPFSSPLVSPPPSGLH